MTSEPTRYDPADDWEAILDEGTPVQTELAPDVGSILGPYRLEKRIAEGGMGTVYQARHQQLERDVAIKVLHIEFCHRPLVVRRFFREAGAVVQLQHPNIVDVADFVEPEDGPPYIVMELLRGDTLTDHLIHEAPLSVEESARLAAQLCSALAAVHQNGIVHRDLKPDNVFLIEGRAGLKQVKLLDFGIAKFLASKDELLKTRTGQALGTPEYMAPEQIIGVDVDQRADIYAIGAILYEMLTGEVVFSSRDLNELFARQLEEMPEPPSARLAAKHPDADPIPDWLDSIVMRCLVKDPEHRLQTMTEIVDALHSQESIDWSAGMTGAFRIADLEKTIRRRKRGWRRFALPGAAALVAAVALVVLALVFLGNDEKPIPASAQGGSTTAKKKSVDGVHAPRGTTAPHVKVVQLVSEPAGATIIRVADGLYLGKTPVGLRIGKAKAERVRLRLAGHQDAEVTVKYGAPTNLRVILNKARRTPSQAGNRTSKKKTPRARRSRRRRAAPRVAPRRAKQRASRRSRRRRSFNTLDPF